MLFLLLASFPFYTSIPGLKPHFIIWQISNRFNLWHFYFYSQIYTHSTFSNINLELYWISVANIYQYLIVTMFVNVKMFFFYLHAVKFIFGIVNLRHAQLLIEFSTSFQLTLILPVPKFLCKRYRYVSWNSIKAVPKSQIHCIGTIWWSLLEEGHYITPTIGFSPALNSFGANEFQQLVDCLPLKSARHCQLFPTFRVPSLCNCLKLYSVYANTLKKCLTKHCCSPMKEGICRITNG